MTYCRSCGSTIYSTSSCNWRTNGTGLPFTHKTRQIVTSSKYHSVHCFHLIHSNRYMNLCIMVILHFHWFHNNTIWPSIATTDYISISEQFTFDSSVSTTQVCLSVVTLEDELVEDLETVVIAATGNHHGISVSGTPVTLEVHSRECELIISTKCVYYRGIYF